MPGTWFTYDYSYAIANCKTIRFFLSIADPYTKGSGVWIPDSQEVWKPAVLIQVYKEGDKALHLRLKDGLDLWYPVNPSSLPPLRNPEVLIGENDLTALSFLHEAAVLNSLRVRFLQGNNIYTYCGIVLVAINPYEQLPIYGDDIIAAYSKSSRGELDPHIFAVAEEAFTLMGRDGQNQSIIISGESGAGKTMSAKYVVRYFATVGGAYRDTNIEERVLASNPIMEAIGNAKTTRNDNSSRFGKYVEIGFNTNHQIVGAGMRTYLLEKSRVTFQAASERNYHIFYQLCACCSHPEFEALQLADASEFHYTNQGGDLYVEGVHETSDLQRTRKAFSLLGFSSFDQFEMFRIISAILHLGNVELIAHGADHCYVKDNDYHLEMFCSLLGVECTEMAKWLCNRKFVTVAETYVTPMSISQAFNNRDALAKHMYGSLFHWTVTRVNQALSTGTSRHSFIGVLDIYGFETFKVNSFEQFCINYANEKLQQQFNWHVFQLEQTDYIQEQIPWTLIDFYDNQPCIDLIEGRLGILDLLDEECKMPNGSDRSWALKLYDRHSQTPHFLKPPLSRLAFTVRHFADEVQYSCSGFLEKNRDSIYEEPIKILRASKCKLVSELFQEDTKDLLDNPDTDRSTRKGVTLPRGRKSFHMSAKSSRRTIGCQFRASLQQLMSVLNCTNPHYVRCIKPNDSKKPFLFEPHRAVQQLRACGVLETIRISAAGYPSRWTYEEFFSRYRFLTQSVLQNADMKENCRQALNELVMDPNSYQLGNTKVFFRAGQVAYLERQRGKKLFQACVVIQKRLRGWVARKQFIKLRKATITLQAYVRGLQSRRLLIFLRHSRAAKILQTQYRMITARRHFIYQRKMVITLQKYTRGLFARRFYHQFLLRNRAVLLQTQIRGWLARRRFAQIRSATLYLQCCWRRVCARRVLHQLKLEARSVQRYQQLNKGLEIKIMQLQCQINKQNGELQRLQFEISQMTTTLQAGEDRLHTDLEHTEKLRAELQRLHQEKEETDKLHTQERENLLHYSSLCLFLTFFLSTSVSRITIIGMMDKKVKNLEEKQELLKEEMNKMTECVRDQQLQLESMTTENVKLTYELDSEHKKFQNLLKELSKLEQHSHNMMEEQSCHKEERAYSLAQGDNSMLEMQKNILIYGNTKIQPVQEKPDMNRLNQENQSLREQLVKQQRNMRKLKKQLQVYKGHELGTGMIGIHPPQPPQDMCHPPDVLEQVVRPWRGMLVCHPEDEALLIQTIITDLRPEDILDLEPELPAYVLFMCFRYADYNSAEHHVLSLFTASVNGIKRIVKKNSNDFDLIAFWFCNTLRLMHCLKQYSGELETRQENTPEQNQHCLQHFDMSSHWHSLSSLCASIYKRLLKAAAEKMQPIILPGMLQNDNIQGLSCPRIFGLRNTPTRDSLNSLLLMMNSFHSTLRRCHLQSDVNAQILRHFLHTICGVSLNHLLLHKDVCCWSRGVQIRYNISQLEEWLRERGFHTVWMLEPLEPLVQASQLLQVKKITKDDALAVCSMCTALSPAQVVKILGQYTPLNDFEERVSSSFIRSVQELLQGKVRVEGTSQLLVDVNILVPAYFPYNRSSVCLNKLRLPQCVNLSFLRRL
ncbi:unconventional myosin-Vb-like [Bombina bombina]|uniref:unconventional myosin-Vb-like n=1 Tax=Bombina bombina TaxID=8345 RepID=UPI00235AF48A|nr:unconventional myosin-Vb-like [Bombina bombina]